MLKNSTTKNTAQRPIKWHSKITKSFLSENHHTDCDIADNFTHILRHQREVFYGKSHQICFMHALIAILCITLADLAILTSLR